MSFRRQLFFYFIIIFCLSFTTFGYAAERSFKTHSELTVRAKNIKIIGFLPLDVKVHELAAGGVRELRDDWSTNARENIMKVLIEGLREKK